MSHEELSPDPDFSSAESFWTPVDVCGACRRRFVFRGIRFKGRTYCSARCLGVGRTGLDGYCTKCRSASTDEPFEGVSSFNGIGTALGLGWLKCPLCHSMIYTKWMAFIYVPFFPLACYRGFPLDEKTYSTRRTTRRIEYWGRDWGAILLLFGCLMGFIGILDFLD